MKVPATAAAAAAATSLSCCRPGILLFGDSITECAFGADGWASLLAGVYTRRADVYNRGYSGYNTKHAVALLPRVLPPPSTTASTSSSSSLSMRYLFSTIWFGANDAVLPGEIQHLPIQEYTSNLLQMMKIIHQHTGYDTPIIVLTPPPVDEVAWAACRGIEKSDRTNQRAREYGLECMRVVQEYMTQSRTTTTKPNDTADNTNTGSNSNSVAVLDVWTLLQGDSSARSQYLSDGLHLDATGNQRVFEAMVQLIQEKFPHLAPMLLDDCDGTLGTGIPVEEKLWSELEN